MEKLDVVGAVIVEAGRVFCTQRGTGPLAGLWEFPGGKVEPGEAPEQSLAREIHEELGCTIDVGPQLEKTVQLYAFAEVTLTTFACTVVAGTPELSEHTDGRWLRPEDLDDLDWAPADIPTVRRLRRTRT